MPRITRRPTPRQVAKTAVCETTGTPKIRGVGSWPLGIHENSAGSRR
jgi:hypothetical protein